MAPNDGAAVIATSANLMEILVKLPDTLLAITPQISNVTRMTCPPMAAGLDGETCVMALSSASATVPDRLKLLSIGPRDAVGHGDDVFTSPERAR